MHQHWVPASYLRAWCDPNSAHLPNPYVWRFSNDGAEVRCKSPEKLFRESNMYTFEDQNGQPNQMIEQGLSKLEDLFERLRRDKIMRCEPLTDEGKATLCLFVATAHFRTPKMRDHWKDQWGKVVELGDRMKANVESLSSEEKAELQNFSIPASGPTLSFEEIRTLAEHPLRRLPQVTNIEAGLLSDMTITILCTSDDSVFITSDAPVVWFDPELYKMPAFYRGLGLGSRTIEVTMPISPNRLVLFTHGRTTEGYVPIRMDLIDENNRRTRFHCDDHFVSNSSRKKDIWFDPGTPPSGWQQNT